MTEEFDIGTSTGRLMLTMLCGFASHERDVIRERSVAGTNRVAEAGAWLGCIVSYGYRKAGEKQKLHLMVCEEPRQLDRSESVPLNGSPVPAIHCSMALSLDQ